MGGEVHLLSPPHGHGPQRRMDAVREFPGCVTSVVARPLPRQQDETVVVKQSKQSPLTAALSLIYKQDFSAILWLFSDGLRKPCLCCLIRACSREGRMSL